MDGRTASRFRDWTLLIVCNLIWASQFVLAKLVQEQMGPIFATLLPMAARDACSSCRWSGASSPGPRRKRRMGAARDRELCRDRHIRAGRRPARHHLGRSIRARLECGAPVADAADCDGRNGLSVAGRADDRHPLAELRPRRGRCIAMLGSRLGQFAVRQRRRGRGEPLDRARGVWEARSTTSMARSCSSSTLRWRCCSTATTRY